MRLLVFFTLLLVCIWCVAAAANPEITHVARQNNSPTKTKTQTATKTGATHTATGTKKAGGKKHTGLTKAAKIGIGVGVPLGVIAIAGAIGCYIIGKRRGRKRRVDDPNAGAGKHVQDPSPELNLPPPAPAVAELPTVRSDEFTGQQKSAGSATWWNPFGRKEPTKAAYTSPPNAPQSPQEMPA